MYETDAHVQRELCLAMSNEREKRWIDKQASLPNSAAVTNARAEGPAVPVAPLEIGPPVR